MFHPPLHPPEFHSTVGPYVWSYRSSYETPSSSSSLTLPIWMRYRGTSVLILDTEFEDESSDLDDKGEGSEDKGPGLDDKGHGLEDEGPGSKEEEEEAAHEVSPSSPVVPSRIALLVTTPAATISVDEDHLLEYQFRSLKKEQERATMTFSAIWRPILALEAWRENHDLRRQIAKERRERLELTDRVARMERRQESGGE
ncbi:hypothetical protein Tco_0988194 [Tanacetum coccineum]|uniref:Uncharacterized protein n=1 Tax=Tanacetum coccineum TaxID=301880 RepID=A0ABQ5EQB6_9ASTR